MADDVLYQGVKGVTDLMVRPGLINLDFADVRSVMDEMGKAMMGTGEAEGEDRAGHHTAPVALAQVMAQGMGSQRAPRQRGQQEQVVGGGDAQPQGQQGQPHGLDPHVAEGPHLVADGEEDLGALAHAVDPHKEIEGTVPVLSLIHI